MRSAITWPAFLFQGALLCVAFVATLHTAGNELIPLAGWLAPLAMLKFVRQGKSRTLLLGLGVTIAAQMLAWRGVLPFGGWIYYAVTGLVGAWFFTPFLLDRLVGPRLPPVLRILLFPTAWVSMEFVLANAGFGAWGLLAYSQFGVDEITQLASIGGLYAISFLITSSASVMNALLENRGRAIRNMAFGYACMLIAVLAYGAAQLNNPVDAPQVRVAGIVVDNLDVFRDTWGPLSYGTPLTQARAAAAAPQVRALQDELFSETIIAARQGATIIVWSEANAMVFAHDEPAFLAKAEDIARREGIYLFAAYANIRPGERLAENKLVLFEPSGRMHDAYLKSHPTPGEASIAGDGKMGMVDTPYGRLAWAICYDFDYVDLIRQAQDTDILIAPAWEHSGMDPLHARMATFRAIENGAALFRVTNDATSIATNAAGKVLAERTAGERARPFVAELPVRGRQTIYGYIHDAFAWLCIIALMGLGAVSADQKHVLLVRSWRLLDRRAR